MMNDKRLDIYENWKRYLGCGNPNAKIWIIGIEEGGAVEVKPGQSVESAVEIFFETTLAKFNHINIEGAGEIYFQTNETVENSGIDALEKPSPVWSGIYTILKNLIADPSKCLIRIDSDVFISNIYPLGNKNLKNWEYEKAIGLSKKQYVNDMKNVRPGLFQTHLKDKIVIFHGKGHWHDAYKILGVNENDFDVGLVNGELNPWLRVHKTKKIIFTRHFANGMPNLLLDEISRMIKEKRWLES